MMAIRTLIRPSTLRCSLLAFAIAGCIADGGSDPGAADVRSTGPEGAPSPAAVSPTAVSPANPTPTATTTPASPAPTATTTPANPTPTATTATATTVAPGAAPLAAQPRAGGDGDIIPTSADLAIALTDGVTTMTAGGSVTYTITAANLAGDDVIGATVADSFPSDLTCVWTCIGISGGACTAAGSGDISDVVSLPVGGGVVYSASCVLSGTTTATQIANTAIVVPPGPVTDPVPGNNAATDVDTVVHLSALLVGSKTVAGNFVPGGTVTYTIVVSNISTGTQLDNAGHEMIDVLPAELTLVSASATSGTAVASIGTNTVTWDGSIASNASVTITIVATINASAGTRVSNQATMFYDSQGTGTNDASATTDAFPCLD